MVLNYGNAGQWLTNAMVNQPNPEIDIVFLVYPESVKAVHEGIGMEPDAGGAPERRRRLRRLVRRLQPPSRRSRLRIVRNRLPYRHGRRTDLVGRSLGPEVQG